MSPIDARSLLPSPADEALADGGTRTRSSSPSSSRSDFGPFIALRSFDDADPRELAGEGWDSDADWGFGGPEPCDSDVDGQACRQEANEVGLLWRTVDPSLLDDATLTGDTSLSLAQVVLCLRAHNGALRTSS